MGCAGSRQPAPTPTTLAAQADPWVLTWTDPTDPTPALLWNGLIGVRIGRDGTGVDENNDPLGFLAIDEYERKGEEKIVPLPTPLAMQFSDGRHNSITPTSGKNYRQTLDMRTGILTTEWTQLVSDVAVVIRGETVLHPSKRIIGQKWTFTTDRKVTLYGSGWPKGAVQPDEPETVGNTHSRVRFEWPPHGRKVLFEWSATGGVADRPTAVFENDAGPSFVGVAEADKPATLIILCSFGSSPTWFVQQNQGGLAAKPPKGWGEPSPVGSYEKLATSSTQAWAKRWSTDIEIDGPIEDQQAIRSFLFYLRSAIHPDGGMSISPFGLSNPLYNGHVFWDADMWVFPALCLVEPALAKAIGQYRWKRKEFAEIIFRREHPEDGGMRFPWESAISGSEVAPTKFRRQLHVTGGVVWMLAQWNALGLYDGTAWDLIPNLADQASSMYRANAGKNRDGKLSLNQIMSPDENHVGNNDLYTNLVAEWCLNGGGWADGHAAYSLPRDDNTFLTYDNDPIRAYNQAAAVLAIYPLQYPPAEKEARQMMERFANKIAENGPAMSDSIHATIWARLGETEKAYETWRKSWQRYTNHPLMLFAERPKSGETYFTTGAAGCLNAVIYGFLGFRIDEKKLPGAVWSKQLLGARWLSIKPNLPKAWKSVKFKNFKVLGNSYTLTVTRKGASVTQGER